MDNHKSGRTQVGHASLRKRPENKQKHIRASYPLQPVASLTSPAMQPNPDEAKRSTVEAAFPSFRQTCPEFTDEELRTSLASCWRIDLIEQAFEHLISSKFGGPAACSDEAGPSNPQVAAHVDETSEDAAFESERAQMRAAMQQSELEAAAYNAVHQKPVDKWSCEDYKQQFPNSNIVEQVDSEGLLEAFCCKTVREKALSLLRLEKKCCKWWRKEPGVRGYFRELSSGVVEACRRTVTNCDIPEGRADKASTNSNCSAAQDPASGQVEEHNAQASEADVPQSQGSSPRRSKRIRDKPSSDNPLQTMGAEHDNEVANGDCSSKSPSRKVQCVARMTQQPSTISQPSDLLHSHVLCEKDIADSEDPGAGGEESASSLGHVLFTLTCRVQEEVLAACHDSSRGAEIVPQVFVQYRPADWNTVETIDLLDE